MSSVAIIPAKGGSVRIPRKNIRPFHGKPIIAYSIEAAKASGLFDSVYVSTDDAEIAEIAKRYGAKVLDRPEELTRDEFGPNDIVGHALYTLSYIEDRRPECACCIYATAPMLRVEDLRRGYDALGMGIKYAISVNGDRESQLQDAAQFIFGFSDAFVRGLSLFEEHTALIPIPAERVCDINVEDDWMRAEAMYQLLVAR